MKFPRRSFPSRKSVSLQITLCLAALVMATLLEACSGHGSNTPVAPNLSTIAVSPASASIAVAGTQQFTAIGTYTDGSTKDLTSSVTWSSTIPATATISSAGLATAIASGKTVISAALAGTGATATLTVTSPLASIAVTPATVSLAIAATQQFIATATYMDGTTANISSTVAWSSSAPTTATVSSTGLATAVAAGQSTITATLSGVSGAATVSVNPALQSIAVTPATPTIASGGTQQFVATATYSDGTTGNISPSVAWTSSAPTIATISASGLATGVAVGSTTITASLSGISGTAALTISASGVNVSHQVVDSQSKMGLAGFTVAFTSGGSTITTTTDAYGNFTTRLAPGSYTLAISQFTAALLTGTATIAQDGSIAEYPTAIPVTITGDPISSFIPDDTTPTSAFTVSPSSPTSGQTVTVAYSDPSSTATSVAVAFTGAGCGSLISAQMNGHTYQQMAAVGDAGSCHAVATVVFPSGTQTFSTDFTVVPVTITLPALSVAGSNFVAGDSLPAAANQTGNITITSVTGPGTLINGATEHFTVQLTGVPTGATAVSLAIQIEGQPGYFLVPAKADTNGNFGFDLVLDQDYFTSNTNPAFRERRSDIRGRINPSLLTEHGRLGAKALAAPTGLILDIQGFDSQGNITPPLSNTFMTQQVGAGTLQVSLSWDQLVDVDLHVVEPDGEEIYYGNSTASDGGTLDLDSNAGCSIDGVNNENVTWPAPAKPGNGTYIVRVDYYANCNDNPVNYQVTVNNCSQVSQFKGSFVSADADFGAAGAGVTITSFPFTSCSGATVQGRATYDDYQPSLAGLATTPVPLPIRDATVEVRHASDDSVLQTGSTDDDGMFNITFTNTGTPGYYLAFLTQSPAADAVVNQKVLDLSSKPYQFASPQYDETTTPSNTGLALNVTKADGSGAFNIYNQGVSAFRYSSTYVSAPLPALTWVWAAGANTAACPGGSCYLRSVDQIQVLGDASNPSEFYNSVELHEFGHFFQAHNGSYTPLGAMHGFGRRANPDTAWAEGWATFFGQSVMGSPTYIDVTATRACICANLDLPLAGNLPLGTAKPDGTAGTQTDFLSEAVPGSAMWNLKSQYGPAAVFSTGSSMSTLASDAATTRDFMGWDFVDFLDSWSCAGKPQGTAATGFKSIVTTSLNFPYDYTAACHP